MTASERGRMRIAAAVSLQAMALLILAVAVWGGTWLDTRARPRVIVLVDRSSSMPRAQTDTALHTALQEARSNRTSVEVLEFAGKVRLASESSSSLQPDATNIEAALYVALSRHAEQPLDRVVVISDGFENAGRAQRALQLARDAGLDVQWIPVPTVASPARIVSVVAPDRARMNQAFTIKVQATAATDQALRVRLTLRTATGDLRQVLAPLDAHGSGIATVDAREPGAVIIDATLEDGGSGNPLHTMTAAAVIDVLPPARLLYVQAGPGVLARSLRAGGWQIEIVQPARLDAYIDGIDRYAGVVLDDVAIDDASPRFWRALVTAVQERGTGLAVVGGEHAFARGAYRESELESVLPLLSEPSKRVQPTQIVFAVDKSGSMGQGSGGVNRFQLAQRAVVETVRTLGNQDSIAVLVFDVDARTLMPLRRATEATEELSRDWPVTPNGGTRIAPILNAALDAFDHSTNARRMLVIVTDGFLDDAPLEPFRERLQNAGVETIAIVVGPDADERALQRLVQGNGIVLHAMQAAQLPLTLRAGVERRRAHVDRGVIPVLQSGNLPFTGPSFEPWPPIAAHSLTRTQSTATVALTTRGGDPIMAWQRAEHGRVVAITSAFGAWAPQWTTWREWPRFAGALATWITASGTDAGEISVTETDHGPRVDVDVTSGAQWGTASETLASVTTPDLKQHTLALRPSGPGRLTAWLPDVGSGLYAIVFSSTSGASRLLYLRTRPDEASSSGTSPVLELWRASGLITDRASPPPRGRLRDHDRPIDRSLIALALMLAVAGVLIDRGFAPWSPLRTLLRRVAQR